MKSIVIWVMMIWFGVMAFPDISYAAPPSDTLANTCTEDPVFDLSQLENFLQNIIDTVDGTLTTIAQDLFEGLVANDNFYAIVVACLVLYLMIYGICFMFGLVPANFYIVFIRLFKMAVILLLFHPDAWYILFDTSGGEGFISGLFQDGVCYMIEVMLAIGTGTDPGFASCVGGSPEQPFELLNGLITLLLSPRMFIIILSAFGTGPFGALLGFLIVFSMTYVLRMILEAMRVYVLYLIVKTLLFGLAPIFFVFMLFDRTKHVFDGWLKQLVSISIQTIMMFAYLSFYVVLLESAAWDMVPRRDVEVCYTKVTQTGVEDVHTWRFMVDGQPYEGQWSWKGIVDPDADPAAAPKIDRIFPINPVKILIFLLISYIGFRMMTVVLGIAAELTGGLSFSGMGGKMSGALQKFTGSGG